MGEVWHEGSQQELAKPVAEIEEKWKLVPAFLQVCEQLWFCLVFRLLDFLFTWTCVPDIYLTARGMKLPSLLSVSLMFEILFVFEMMTPVSCLPR